MRPHCAPTPVSVGVVGLVFASLIVSGLELGWVPVAQRHLVGLLMFAAVVPLQSLTGIMAVAAGDGAVATAMAILVAAWGGIGATFTAQSAESTSAALGLLIAVAAWLLAGAGVVLARNTVLIGLTLGLASLRFGVTALYELSAATGWKTASGLIGLGVAALAVYGVWALVEEAHGPVRLPLGRHGS